MDALSTVRVTRGVVADLIREQRRMARAMLDWELKSERLGDLSMANAYRRQRYASERELADLRLISRALRGALL